MRRGLATRTAQGLIVLAAALSGAALTPAPAAALNPLKPVCKVAQLGSGAVSKLCGVLSSPRKFVNAGGKLVTGHIGGALHAIFGGGGGGSAAATAVGLAAIGVWVLGGAKFALHETANVLSRTTSPQLRTTWFSAAYWRMSAVAALITLPFLFAAAVQALIRADVALLGRAAFGYLPLALLSVGIAAPLTMLLLAATDQLSAVVAAAAGHESSHFLVRAGEVVGVLGVFRGSPFLAFLVGLIAAAGALVLWLELLMREAAVYIVVLMLPLAFAAMVWPARRIWAIRAVEVLIALILAKFAIVAVLALGGAALGHGGGGITGALAGAVLVLLGAFAPWALLRLLPLTELASGAAGALRGHARLPVGVGAEDPAILTGPAAGWARVLTAGMRRDADEVGVGVGVDSRSDHAARDESARLTELDRASEPQAEGFAQECFAPALTGVGAADAAGEGAAGRTGGTGGAGDGAAGGGHGAEIGAGGTGETGETGATEIGASGASGAELGANGAAHYETPGERSPGLGPMWQAPDLSWRPLELGGEWPPPPLWPWPPGEAAAGEAKDGNSTGAGASGQEEAPGEDHDSRPAPQDSEHGPL